MELFPSEHLTAITSKIHARTTTIICNFRRTTYVLLSDRKALYTHSACRGKDLSSEEVCSTTRPSIPQGPIFRRRARAVYCADKRTYGYLGCAGLHGTNTNFYVVCGTLPDPTPTEHSFTTHIREKSATLITRSDFPQRCCCAGASRP